MSEIKECLKVYNFDNKIRLGVNNDGGYVFGNINSLELQEFLHPIGVYDCYISAGVSNEESFSRDFIEMYGMNKDNCFAFDGTIVDYPYNYTNKITFFKKNINNFNDDNNSNLSFLTEKYNNIFLKMDIEGGEYPWILSIDENTLSNFKQIVIEFHGINDDSWGCINNDKIKCLKKLSKTHYLIHAHGNNYSNVTNGIPDVIELSYINKNYITDIPILNSKSLPIDNLDYPNNSNLKDFNLNFYPFVENNSRFPKVIYMCDKTLDHIKIYSKNWITLNPDYEMNLYDHALCEKFLLEEYSQTYKDLYKYIPDGPIKADFWRVCVLYKNGGIYVDADIEPLVPLNSFINFSCDFITCSSFVHEDRIFNANFIIAHSGDNYLKDSIDLYLKWYTEKNPYSYWGWSIMKVFTDVIHIENYNKEDGIYNVSKLNNKKIQILKECSGINHHDEHHVYNNMRVFNDRYKFYDDYNHCFFPHPLAVENINSYVSTEILDEHTIVNKLIELRFSKKFKEVCTLGEYYCKIYSHNYNILFEYSIGAYYNGDVELSYDLNSKILECRNLNDEGFNNIILSNSRFSINSISDRYIYYNREIVDSILKRQQSLQIVTFSITSCKRFDLFEKTMNSFLNSCTDILRIDNWFCIDDNSSEEDRIKMRELYPFFTFYFKTPEEKGHPNSMNIISNYVRNVVKTPFLFHIEDDWKFFVKKNYISECIEVLGIDNMYGQCLINKNYAEIDNDIVNIKGGIFKKTISGLRYYLHEYCSTEESRTEFNNKYNGVSCNYWPHFSFRPSLIRTSVFNRVGVFNKVEHFEMDYSYRYNNSGFKSVFLENIYCIHTGRLTSERNDISKNNAYTLNNEIQLHEPKKKCIFICIFNNENYIDMFYLMLESIYMFGKLDNNTDILIYTSFYFSEKIKQHNLYNVDKIKFEINNNYNTIDTACKSRLDVFTLESIYKYSKILYLDTDIIIKNSINKVFDIIDDDILYVLEEGNLNYINEEDWWGRNLFTESEINSYSDTSAFTSGILLFNNCEKIKVLFEKIKEDINIRPLFFNCYDQPYIVYNSFKYNLYNNKLLKNFAVNNDTSNDNNKVIYHFPGWVGYHTRKINIMIDVLNKLKKIPKIIIQTSIIKPEQYVKDMIQSYCTDWEYIHFIDSEIIDFFIQNPLEEFPNIINVFNSFTTGAHKADLFRYYFLYIKGGVFLDSDAMFVKNLNDIVQNFSIILTKASSGDVIFNGFIGVYPNNIIIYEALKHSYNTSNTILINNYLYFCTELFNIYNKHKPYLSNIKLYKEDCMNNGICNTIDENNNIIFIHYYQTKIIPEILNTFNTKYGNITLYNNDIYIISSFNNGNYLDEDNILNLQQYINTNRNILEIGGHCGTSSIIYSTFIQNNKKIFIYEPQKNMFNLLVRNINQNNLQNKIIPHNFGVFCYNGTGSMNDIDLDGGLGIVSKRYNEEHHLGCNFGGIGLGENGESINLITIDSMNLDDIGYIHCDAQGSENFIFSKGIELITRNRPVILYENKELYGTYLYDNICKSYTEYTEESVFDIKKYCMETLHYSSFIDRFNGGIDTLLIP